MAARHDLPVDECLRLLRSHRSKVGRVGFVDDEGMTILPVNFRLLEGEVVFRTGQGSLLRAAGHKVPVAFEVDDVDTTSGEAWSVLVRGTAREIVDPDENDFAAMVVHSWAERDWYGVAITPSSITGRRISGRPP